MKKYKIFVACDTSDVNFVRKIIRDTKNKKFESTTSALLNIEKIHML